jgi:hypothetical protein
MAARNVTIERLSARVERELNTDSKRIDSLSVRETLTKRQREVLERARSRKERNLEAQTRLSDLSSGAGQKERYGLTRWQIHYCRVSAIENNLRTNPLQIPISERELQDRVIKALGGTAFLRFQRAYCKPIDFVAPRFRLSRDGRIEFINITPDELQSLSVGPCLVSPDLLPTTLVESLRLYKFTAEEKKCRLSMLSVKAKPAVVDGIKMIFDAGYFPASSRVLVLAQPRPDITRNYPRAPAMSAGLPGTVLYFRSKVADSPVHGRKRKRDWRSSTPLTTQHFPTVFKAYRRALHSVVGYEAEYKTLTGVLGNLTELRTSVKSRWRNQADRNSDAETANADLIAKVKERVEADLTRLEKVIDPHKKKTRDLLIAFKDLKDRTERFNPVGSHSQITAAIASIEKRMRSIIPLSSYTEADRKEIWKLIELQARVLVDIRADLERPAVQRLLGTMPSHAEVKRRKEEYINEIAPARSRLAELTVRPYCTLADILSARIDALKDALSTGSIKNARIAVGRMHAVCRLAAMSSGIASLEEKLSNPETYDVPSALELSKRVLERTGGGVYEELLPTTEAQTLRYLRESFGAAVKDLEDREGAFGDERAQLFADVKAALGEILPERAAFGWLSRVKRRR